MTITATRFQFRDPRTIPPRAFKTGRARTRKVIMHDEWPYGLWTCASGREIIFNRSYWPIWQRIDGVVTRNANLCEWVDGIVEQKFFYDDASSPWRTRRTWPAIKAVMAEWGIPDGP
jgi:hypothetical protein